MEPIAITGLSFKLPQNAEDESSFWEILENGRNVMTKWPESRVNVDGFYSSDSTRSNSLHARGAHFMKEDPAAFDAPFFSITSNEAESMDPQQRWLLETSYRALENAGIPAESVAGSQTSVFAASMADDYFKFLSKDPDEAPTNTATGTSPSILANRLSWYFDLRGPSIQLNTACSSSMVAMDLACQSLRSGQSSMALVTGSNLLMAVEASLYLSNMNFLSPDSVCYSFDHRANGYSRGEGVVVFVLKKLSDAIRNSDMIRAVIRGTGSNQDGRTPGLTQPNPMAQEELIRQVYKSCNLGFESTRYVEAHGTGTQIGDSTEMKAIGRVFRTSRSPKDPLYVGSVKANIGHLEGASGLASILKGVMMLEKGIIPPNALFEKMNPKINAKFYNIQVPTACITWPGQGLRRISVNSFGFGGSNGHIILDDAYHSLQALGLKGNHQTLVPVALQKPTVNGIETKGGQENGETTNGTLANGITNNEMLMTGALENGKTHHNVGPEVPGGVLEGSQGVENPRAHSLYPAHNDSVIRASHSNSKFVPEINGSTAVKNQKPTPKLQLLVWSARNEAALQRMLKKYSRYYEAHISDSWDQMERLAYTLSGRRSLMTWRSFGVIGTDTTNNNISLSSSDPVRVSKETGIAFVFTGQGAQYAKMGMELVQFPVFKSTLDKASRAFRELGAKWSLFEEIKNRERINKPEFSQPACTALQIALVELLKSFNIIPVAVIGHSSGEIAAAYTVGALSLKSACKVAYHRGRLVERLAESTSTPGAMMSVNLSEGDVFEYLRKVPLVGEIHIACVNSPFNITLSGDETSIEILKESLEKDEIFAQKLRTGVGYHSPAMKQISEEYLRCLGCLEQWEPDDNTVLMVSSVTGESISSRTVSEAQYWVDNLISPVRFADALQYLVLAVPKVDRHHTVYDFLELGPHGALRKPLTDTIGQLNSGKRLRYATILSKFDSNLKTTLETAGRLFSLGYPISIAAVNKQDATVRSIQFLADTPEYPFGHSQLYWHETRLSRDWRLRGAVPRDTLGMRATDWNPLEPQWRKTLSIEEIPWIADHVVGDTALYPATGIVMMALEAMKQTADTSQIISGYRIKEATFINPIVVRPGPEGKTEVMTHLRRLQQPYEKASLRSEVRIFSQQDDHWSECFNAIICTEYEEALTEVDGGYEARVDARTLARNYEQAKKACVNQVSKQDFYKWHHKQGLKYGEAFSLAEEIYWDGGEFGVARVDVCPPTNRFEGVVHPAVLDAACQVCFTAPSKGMLKSLPTIIPHKIHDAWVAASGWQYRQSSHIRMLTTSSLKPGGAGLKCSFTALAEDRSPLCYVKHLEMLPVLNNESQGNFEKKLLHGIDWNPHLSLLSLDQLRELCDADNFTEDETSTVNYCLELEMMLRTLIQRRINQLLDTDWSMVAPHMRKYVSWMERQLQHTPVQPKNDEISEEALDKQLQHLREVKPSWRMFIDIAQNLTSIVRGETDPLELLFSTGLAEDIYDEFFAHVCNHKFVSYLNLASHQIPNQKILEVGAGTGGMTSQVLSALQEIEDRTGGISFSEYVYTDISPTFFDKAKGRFSEYQNRMTFGALDLERDITSQGFEMGTYDMILAGSVLHATKNLSATLQNLRRALKPGGQLVFHETTAPDCFVMSFGFGILPGWWRSEEKFRHWGPTITEPEWDRVLKKNGFSGNDLVLRDYRDNAAHYFSLIISTAQTTPLHLAKDSRILFVVEDHNEYQISVASYMDHGILSSSDYQSNILSLTELEDVKVFQDEYVVFLADIDRSILASASKPVFKLIQRCMQQWQNLLWVTLSDISDDTCSTPYPYTGLKDGFLRTLRSEFNTKRIISLSLEGEKQDMPKCINHISKVFRSAFEELLPEVEYVVRDGQILTGRLVEERDYNRSLNSSIFPQLTIKTWLPGPPLKLDIGSRGSLETLRFVEDTEHYSPLGPEDVEIEAKAWGLSFRDLFIAVGRLEEDGFGADCAGVVTRVGSQCTMIQPGDRVCMAAVGCMRMYPRSNQYAVIKIPDDIPFAEASAIINPGITAYHSLIDVARLQKGEKVLIHAAAGGTGQLAILIAQMVGAEVFATVGFNHKKELLMDQFGIPADHIFYSRNTTFVKGIMRITNGYGVDVVLNSLVGEGLRASWECVAPYGRFIELGKADIKANSSLPMACFARNVSFNAVDLRHIAYFRKETGHKLLDKTMELVKKGTIHSPRPLHVYPVSSVEQAFRYFQSGNNTGRIVINVNHSDQVPKYVLHRRTWSLEESATYVIAGGLGGIGRAIIKWMATKGAKHFIALSRSGASSQAAVMVMDELAKKGVTIATPKCDVSSADSLSGVLGEYSEKMPPIRGCVNASMVLNDSIFDNMTHTQWERTIQSKVQTSWNLHALLPRNLDFFVLLSSAAGILGSPGQANYASGCTFQDSLARYRSSQHQKAISIDLGLMRTIGIVADTEKLHKNLEDQKSLCQIEEEEFLALLNIYCDPTHPLLSPYKSQITMGMVTPAGLTNSDQEPVELLQRPLFANFSQARGISRGCGPPGTINSAALFRQAESDEDKTTVVVDALVRKLARALCISPEEVDSDKPLRSFGVDSLVAVELRNWIGKEFAADIAVFLIIGGTTVAAIGELVTKTSKIKRGNQKG